MNKSGNQKDSKSLQELFRKLIAKKGCSCGNIKIEEIEETTQAEADKDKKK